MKRGQQVIVRWADILTSPADDPEKADLYVWSNPGYFWGYKKIIKRGKSFRCLILTTAQGEDGGHEQSGYLCIPASLVLDIIEVED